MKSALVTGATGGIGRAIVECFVGDGWQVYGMDIAIPEEPLPSGAQFFQVDVADSAAVEACVATVVRESEGLSALVNNAALQVLGPTLDEPEETWERVLSVNLTASARLTSHCRRMLSTAGGCVVNVASVHAIATSKGIGVYAASKGGLVALTRALALELAPEGIRVNAVLPGAIDTSMLVESLGRSGGDVTEAERKITAATPLGRIGRPADVAEAVRFLSDAVRASFITGSCLTVDGGATARLGTE